MAFVEPKVQGWIYRKDFEKLIERFESGGLGKRRLISLIYANDDKVRSPSEIDPEKVYQGIKGLSKERTVLKIRMKILLYRGIIEHANEKRRESLDSTYFDEEGFRKICEERYGETED